MVQDQEEYHSYHAMLHQLSLGVRTIQTLDAMGANNSQLFETLLNQYEPFLNAWAELGYGYSQEDE